MQRLSKVHPHDKRAEFCQAGMAIVYCYSVSLHVQCADSILRVNSDLQRDIADHLCRAFCFVSLQPDFHLR
jgi:hypothetical protein